MTLIETEQSSIDLDQLALRESEQVEWKENVADIENVVRTLSAFANDLGNLGGGYVVCGAAEIKDEHGFPKLARTGLTAERLKEVEGKVLQLCRDHVSPPITPRVEELRFDDPSRRILVFIQPSTGAAHTFRVRGEGGKHWVRISRETREARNGVLRELLVLRGAQEPWDRRICSGATVNDLDLLALRDALQRMKLFSNEIGVDAYLSEDTRLSAFVPSLCDREPLTRILRPRNFAVLLFGRDPQRFIPGAVGLFSIYPGRDRSDPHAERHELAGTVIEQYRRLSELLDVQSYTAFDKNDAQSPNAVKYPKRALYEAMGNALAHRDYELSDPTRITVFEDRIEVVSPGKLPFGIKFEAFAAGVAGARWRNQALAWFFNRLQIAQAEGQGIPTILRSMREEGCPEPRFDADAIRVVCILPAHPRHALLRELREIEQDLALGELVRAQRAVLRLLERDPANIRLLQLFAEVQMALHDPTPVVERVRDGGVDVSRLPQSVLLQLAEAIISGSNPTEEQRKLAGRLLNSAASGRYEERELRRIVVALLRNRNEESALGLIERHLDMHPEWEENPSLNQLRGDALIGLAKRCSYAAKRSGTPKATRERSWAQFDRYARDADIFLARAEALSLDPGLTSIIKRNRDFLAKLVKSAQADSGREAR